MLGFSAPFRIQHPPIASRLGALLIASVALLVSLPALAQTGPVSPVRTQPLIEVHRSPSCGCCLKWVEHLRESGFRVSVNDTDDMQAVKQRLGVPENQRSCHTAQVGGYFVEGHVPAADIRRLLKEKPKARGLAVPGMPLGSPGMEVPDGTKQPYAVELVSRDGSTTTYSRHGK